MMQLRYSKTHIVLAGIAALLLTACSQSYVGDPWTQNDPQWKQAHFASQTQDEALRERAALTQIDR